MLFSNNTCTFSSIAHSSLSYNTHSCTIFCWPSHFVLVSPSSQRPILCSFCVQCLLAWEQSWGEWYNSDRGCESGDLSTQRCLLSEATKCRGWFHHIRTMSQIGLIYQHRAVYRKPWSTLHHTSSSVCQGPCICFLHWGDFLIHHLESY